MWMMGYNDGGDFNTIPADSFNGGRKLRPLMPRVPPTTRTIHGDNFISLNNHHHLGMTEANKRDFNNTQQLVVSSRWNPTPEQLQTLEELYRRGTRTPSAEQIQHITTQLRRYGKIEGKNVFYWFQNHKARERQKRRRQLESSASNGDSELSRNNVEIIERKESGIEQNSKNWPSPTNCSTTLTEKTVAATRGVQQRNATWQMMNLSCSTPTIPHMTTTTTTTPIIRTVTTTPKQLHHLNFFITPFREDDDKDISGGENDISNGDSQTLELFPLRSNDNDDNNNDLLEKEEIDQISGVAAASNTNYQFFEFLPLKN